MGFQIIFHNEFVPMSFGWVGVIFCAYMKRLFCFFIIYPMCAFGDDCATMRYVPKSEMTLAEIVDIGLCRNPRTAAAYAALQSARYTKNAAHSYYLPKISFGGGGNRLHTQNDDWTYNASLSASYLIFDFGKRESDFAQSLATYRAAGFDYDETIQNYVYSIVGAYYELLNADASVASARAALTVAQTAKNTADKKFNAGAVAKSDVLQADTNLASSQLSLERAKNNREIAKATLLNALSFSATQEIKIKDMPASFGSNAESNDIDKLIEIAKQKRPDLLKADANVSIALHKRNSTFLQYLPSFTINGTAELKDNTVGGMFEHMTAKVSGKFGLSVSMPIFTGFANYYNVRSANSDYQNAKYMEQSVSDNAVMDVFTAYQNYKTAQTVLKQTETLLKSATESERVTSGMYKVGRATMLDWQTAQSDLVNARNQNNSAKYDLFVKRAAVALAIGDIKSGLKESDNGHK